MVLQLKADSASVVGENQGRSMWLRGPSPISCNAAFFLRFRKLLPWYDTMWELRRCIYEGIVTVPTVKRIVDLVDVLASSRKQYLTKDN